MSDNVKKFIAACVVDKPLLDKEAEGGIDAVVNEYCQRPGCSLDENDKQKVKEVWGELKASVNQIAAKVSASIAQTSASVDDRGEVKGFVGGF